MIQLGFGFGISPGGGAPERVHCWRIYAHFFRQFHRPYETPAPGLVKLSLRRFFISEGTHIIIAYNLNLNLFFLKEIDIQN